MAKLNPRADEYVDGAWQQEATPQEVQTGVSQNVSLHSFPPAYRLGQQSPTLYQQQEKQYGTPYRGGVTTAHGIGQLVDVEPPDAPLEDIPSSDGPVIGGNPAETPMSFPEPVPVQVVSMPQTNQIDQQRDGQVRLPPREGLNAVPTVQNVASREHNRTDAWFASDNHEEEYPGDPYCVHVTFQRDIGNFQLGGPGGRSGATWGIPLKSAGDWYGSLKTSEGLYGFNTESFETADFERYLTIPKYLNTALWMLPGMDAENYLGLHTSHYRMGAQPDKALETMRLIKNDLSRMDFLAMVENSKWRVLHFNFGYNSQVG